MSTSTSDTADYIWAGQQLTNPIAIVPFSIQVRETDQRLLLFGSVYAANNQSGLIAVYQLGEFLRTHADCQFVCENAAEFHWTLLANAERVGDADELRRLVWQLSKEHRLLDLQLLDQLIVLADNGDEQILRSMQHLLKNYNNEFPWESTDEIAREAFNFRERELRQFPQELIERATKAAATLQRLYGAMSAAADIGARKSWFPCAVSPNGLLGLGIEVQARIALEKPQASSTINQDRCADVIAELEEDIFVQTSQIRRLQRLKECLKWKGDQIARDDELPIITRAHDRRLRQLLSGACGELLATDGVPFPCLQTEKGEAPLRAEDWGALSRYEPNLHAWARLYDSCDELHVIRKYSGKSIAVSYNIVPRLRPHLRAASLNGLIRHSLLHRPEGGRHYVLRFAHVELRALAAWCDHHFHNSVLAAVYRNGEDPIRRLAAVLTTDNRISEDVRIQLAERLLSAIANKIGRSNFARMVQIELNLDLDSQTATSWEQVAFELFPELRGYQHDVADRLAANLSINRDVIEQSLVSMEDFDSISAQILGRQRGGFAFRQLFNLCQDTEIGVQTMNISNRSALYLTLLGRSFRLPTGRIRGKCIFAAGNAEYLDLADDAMKAALYVLVASGVELVAVADRTVLVWAGEQFDERVIIARTSAAATGILDVPVEISSVEAI